MEFVEVGDGDLEQVVVGAGDEGAFEHLGGRGSRSKRDEKAPTAFPAALDIGDETGADPCRRPARRCRNDSLRFERAHAPETREARADTRRQFLLAMAAFCWSSPKILRVDFVHAQFNATNSENCNIG